MPDIHSASVFMSNYFIYLLFMNFMISYLISIAITNIIFKFKISAQPSLK